MESRLKRREAYAVHFQDHTLLEEFSVLVVVPGEFWKRCQQTTTTNIEETLGRKF